MANKEENLRRQLDEYVKAKNQLINTVEDAGKASDPAKKAMWDATIPLVRSHILEVCEKDVRYDARNLADRVLEKVLHSVLGDEWKSLLEKLA